MRRAGGRARRDAGRPRRPRSADGHAKPSTPETGGTRARGPRQDRRRAARRARRAGRPRPASRARSTSRPPCCASRGCARTPASSRPPITRHLVFNGNPGTGKTTVARLVAGIYKALGLLSQGPAGRGRPLRARRRLPRPDRDQDRRGREVGARRRAVHRRGVLALRRPVRHRGDRHPGQGDGGPPRRPGRDRRRLPRPDGGFVAQNPGLESRFRTHLDFPDYTDDELVEIFGCMASERRVRRRRGCWTGCARPARPRRAATSFGNARHVRNLLEAAIGRHAWRLREVDEPTVEQLRTLEADDLDAPVPLTRRTDPPEPGVVDLGRGAGDAPRPPSPCDPQPPEEAT